MTLFVCVRACAFAVVVVYLNDLFLRGPQSDEYADTVSHNIAAPRVCIDATSSDLTARLPAGLASLAGTRRTIRCGRFVIRVFPVV